MDSKRNSGLTRRTAIAGLAAAGALISTRSKGADGQIGLLLQSYRNPRFKNIDEPSFRRVVEAAGYKSVSLQAEDDPSRQATQMELLLARGCKAIALQPVVGPPTADMVRKAKEADVPVIAYNSSIPSPDVKAFVARNNFAVGKSIAETARSLGALRGRWAIVAGPEALAVASEFVRGLQSVIEPLVRDGTVDLVDLKYHANFSTESAHQQANNNLTRHNDEISGFFCNSDQLAQGVVTAVAQRNLPKVPWIGSQDASVPGCRAILEGRMAMSSFTQFDQMGETAAKLCVLLAEKKPLPAAPTYDSGSGAVPFFEIPFFAVTRDNLVSYLQKYSPSYVDAKAIFAGIPRDRWPAGADKLPGVAG